LEIPDLPEEYTFAWNAFFELNAGRTSNGYGPNPLSFVEIHAFMALTGTVLLPYEIRGIKLVDAVFMKATTELTKASQATKRASQETPTRKTTPTRR
jgi:hypothetical protein